MEKSVIAQNLIQYRKLSRMTQQELAEHLNYSDKAVSKWERGEGIPDVLVLKQIADLYGITLNDLINEGSLTVMPNLSESNRRRNTRHILITSMSVALVFLIATIVVASLGMFSNTIPLETVILFSYILALPVASIILIVFSAIWGKMWMQAVSVSILAWTICVAFHTLTNIAGAWLIYLIGAALQVLIGLWYAMAYVNTTKRAIKKQRKQMKKINK